MKKFLPYFFFILGFCALFYSLFQIVDTTKLPLLGRYAKAYQYYKLAKRFSPASPQYRQYLAISHALLKNQKNFSFETNQMPMPTAAPPGVGK